MPKRRKASINYIEKNVLARLEKKKSEKKSLPKINKFLCDLKLDHIKEPIIRDKKVKVKETEDLILLPEKKFNGLMIRVKKQTRVSMSQIRVLKSALVSEKELHPEILVEKMNQKAKNKNYKVTNTDGNIIIKKTAKSENGKNSPKTLDNEKFEQKYDDDVINESESSTDTGIDSIYKERIRQFDECGKRDSILLDYNEKVESSGSEAEKVIVHKKNKKKKLISKVTTKTTTTTTKITKKICVVDESSCNTILTKNINLVQLSDDSDHEYQFYDSDLAQKLELEKSKPKKDKVPNKKRNSKKRISTHKHKKRKSTKVSVPHHYKHNLVKKSSTASRKSRKIDKKQNKKNKTQKKNSKLLKSTSVAKAKVKTIKESPEEKKETIEKKKLHLKRINEHKSTLTTSIFKKCNNYGISGEIHEMFDKNTYDAEKIKYNEYLAVADDPQSPGECTGMLDEYGEPIAWFPLSDLFKPNIHSSDKRDRKEVKETDLGQIGVCESPPPGFIYKQPLDDDEEDSDDDMNSQFEESKSVTDHRWDVEESESESDSESSSDDNSSQKTRKTNKLDQDEDESEESFSM